MKLGSFIINETSNLLLLYEFTDLQIDLASSQLNWWPSSREVNETRVPNIKIMLMYSFLQSSVGFACEKLG